MTAEEAGADHPRGATQAARIAGHIDVRGDPEQRFALGKRPATRRN
jgi:hypothetical protein